MLVEFKVDIYLQIIGIPSGKTDGAGAFVRKEALAFVCDERRYEDELQFQTSIIVDKYKAKNDISVGVAQNPAFIEEQALYKQIRFSKITNCSVMNSEVRSVEYIKEKPISEILSLVTPKQFVEEFGYLIGIRPEPR